MIPSGQYPAKILLFGEYSILNGSEALALPYPEKSGSLKYDCISGSPSAGQKKSQLPLIKLYEYLSQHLHLFPAEEGMDLRRLRNDLISGLYFDSDIPINYGIGSSGAITAAVYDSYFDQSQQKPIDQIIKTLANIESFFHLKSSGIDPLVSFLHSSVHVVNGHPGKTQTNVEWLRANLNIFLLDSGTQGITKSGMQKNLTSQIDENYLKLNDSLIQSIIRGETQDFYPRLEEFCRMQLRIFDPLFPNPVRTLALKGLEKSDYCIKLCGSGGGGYYLLFSPDKELPDTLKSEAILITPL